MAHFYGTMQGSRGETSRMGTVNSGMTAHVRGWDVGIEVANPSSYGRLIPRSNGQGSNNGTEKGYDN